jgi:hypothetical protein
MLMAMTVVTHSPRVAWDLARTTVAMAGATSERYGWFARQVELCLGADARHELERTRARLVHDERPDIHPIELGRWRVRLEDALAADPGLGALLIGLRVAASTR